MIGFFRRHGFLIFLGLLSAMTVRGEHLLFFPDDYESSRQAFRASCAQFEAECGSWKVPAAKDEDLTVDFFLQRPPGAEKLLVLISGLHGAEAPTGSALLREFLAHSAKEFRKKSVSLLLVHALNPYGFKHLRRVTESNVDLNRNFLLPGQNSPPNEGYAKLRAQLEPSGPPQSLLGDFLKLSGNLIWRLIARDFTLADMHAAVAGGQREFAQGLFYGGTQPEPQVNWLRELLLKTFKGHKEILVIDFHTGLGDRGVLHLMPSDHPPEASVQLREHLFPPRHADYRLTTGKSPGFYPVTGGLLEFAESLAEEDQVVLAMTMEFGTLGDDIFSQLRSLNRMIRESRGYQNGFSSDASEAQIKEHFLDLFNPQAPRWRRTVLRKGGALFSLIQENF